MTKLLNKPDQTWSKLIKIDQTWPNLTKIDQTWSNLNKLVQNGSNYKVFVLEKYVVEKHVEEYLVNNLHVLDIGSNVHISSWIIWDQTRSNWIKMDQIGLEKHGHDKHDMVLKKMTCSCQTWHGHDKY